MKDKIGSFPSAPLLRPVQFYAANPGPAGGDNFNFIYHDNNTAAGSSLEYDPDERSVDLQTGKLKMQGDLGINMESTGTDGVQVLNSDGVSAGYDIILPSSVPGTNESDGALNRSIVEQVTIPSGQEEQVIAHCFLYTDPVTFTQRNCFVNCQSNGRFQTQDGNTTSGSNTFNSALNFFGGGSSVAASTNYSSISPPRHDTYGI